MYASSGQKLTRPEEIARLTENAWRNLSAHERAPYERRVKYALQAGCRRAGSKVAWCVCVCVCVRVCVCVCVCGRVRHQPCRSLSATQPAPTVLQQAVTKKACPATEVRVQERARPLRARAQDVPGGPAPLRHTAAQRQALRCADFCGLIPSPESPFCTIGQHVAMTQPLECSCTATPKQLCFPCRVRQHGWQGHHCSRHRASSSSATPASPGRAGLRCTGHHTPHSMYAQQNCPTACRVAHPQLARLVCISAMQSQPLSQLPARGRALHFLLILQRGWTSPVSQRLHCHRAGCTSSHFCSAGRQLCASAPIQPADRPPHLRHVQS